MNTERKNLPSASGLARYASCPASHTLSLQVPEGDPGPEAERGKRIHAVLAGQNLAELSPDETEAVYDLSGKRDALCEQTFGPDPAQIELWKEQRFWLTDPVTLQPILSGQSDIIVSDGKLALVIDYKTGQWSDQDPAWANWQLMGYAALVAANIDCDTVTVALLQAGHAPTVTTYDAAGIDAATQRVIAVARHAIAGGSPTAGPHCRWCRAKPICPAIQAQLPAEVPKLDVMSPADLGLLLDRCAIADKAIEEIRSYARVAIAAGATVPGWKLTEPGTREKIVNLAQVYTRCELRGVTGQEFAHACSLSKKSLSEIIGKKMGLSGKKLSSEVAALIDGCTETSVTEAKLVKI